MSPNVQKGVDRQKMLNAIGSKVDLSDGESSDYHYLVADLLESKTVQQMWEYTHHGDSTCFQHCLNVSY